MSGMILVAAAQIFVITILNIPAWQASGNLLHIINIPPALFYIVAVIILLKTKISPIPVIIAGALFGVLFL